MRAVLLTMAVIIYVAQPRLAAAEDRQKAREAYTRATQHYDLGEFAAALDGFKEAYRNYEEPSFLFNIAQCQRQLGKKQDAIIFYRSYLRKAPDAANREEVAVMIRRLEGEVEAEKSRAAETSAPTPQSPPPSIVSPQPPTLTTSPRPQTPIYKRWYVWTAVGGLVVAGAAVGLGVGLSRSSLQASTDFGTVQPAFR